MAGGISDDDVRELLPVLAERARATEKTADTFRPPRVGIVEQVAANWHHFVVGRRGVGKSMLLLNVAAFANERSQPSVYIDLETLRDNPYPDVLIRLLGALAAELERVLREMSGWRTYFVRRRARNRLRDLRTRLNDLLKEPQEAEYRVADASEDRRKSRKERGAAAAGGIAKGDQSLSGSLGASSETARTRTSESGRQATYVRTKLDGLRGEATEFRSVLSDAVKATGDDGVLVILDDFYFINRENQPDVLAYLHQVTKNLGIWLKVGAVEHRLNEFEDGNPPRGLQLTQDAGKVPMDVTLADFDHTRAFLEGILEDVCSEAGVDMSALLTDSARLRLVIASGGVPRDYVNLVTAALDKATRRPGSHNRPKNRISAEDVNVAVPAFLKQKEDDLRVDASPDDVERLRERLYDLLNFCLVHQKANVFTVDARLLREEQWGRDIAALSDLRFFHSFGNLTVKSSGADFVGQRYEGFALDLSAYAATRVRTNEVDFWTTDGFQKCRAARFVYTPGVSNELSGEPARLTDAPPPQIAMDEHQITIFDELDE